MVRAQSHSTEDRMGVQTLTDSGLETWLVFHRDVDLPHFAAFPLLNIP